MKALLTTKEVASLLGISSGTLENWRSQKRGPRYVKMPGRGGFNGGPVRYLSQDVQRWILSNIEGDV